MITLLPSHTMGNDCPDITADEEGEIIIPCECPDAIFLPGHAVSHHVSSKTGGCGVFTHWYYEVSPAGYIGSCWPGGLDIDDKFTPYMTIEDGSGALQIYNAYSNNSGVYICEVSAQQYYTLLVIHGQ